jgi:hypothetical protein
MSSAEDDKLRSRGKTVARIQGLDNPNLQFGVPHSQFDKEMMKREQKKLRLERKRHQEEQKAAKLARKQARLAAIANKKRKQC